MGTVWVGVVVVLLVVGWDGVVVVDAVSVAGTGIQDLQWLDGESLPLDVLGGARRDRTRESADTVFDGKASRLWDSRKAGINAGFGCLE